MGLLKTAVSLRSLGGKDMTQLLQSAPMCVADFLNDHFETELLKAGLSTPALWSSFNGPWSPGTTTNLVIHESLKGRHIVGGGQALVKALAKVFMDLGGVIKTGKKVFEVIVEDGRAVGVKLENGDEYRAGKIVSSCDSQTSLLQFLPSHHLTNKLENRVRNIRSRGTAAVIHFATQSAPQLKCRPGKNFENIRIAPSLDDVERAFDSVKYGEFSKKPSLEIYTPTLSDSSLSKEGQHVVSVMVNYAPFNLRAGWDDEQKKSLFENVIGVLNEHLEGFEKSILGFEVVTPQDIETEFGATGGHLFHGEHALDQLITRPTPETANYESGVPGYFLCGSSCHPGGGISGRNGAIAVDVILRS